MLDYYPWIYKSVIHVLQQHISAGIVYVHLKENIKWRRTMF